MTTKLEQAIAAIETLPAQAQDAIAVDLIEEVESYTTSQLTADQHAVVRARLSKPLETISHDVVEKTFGRFKHPA